jgi:hypothetical protein
MHCAELCSSAGRFVQSTGVQLLYTHRLNHLTVQVIALTGALTHTSKHGETTCSSSSTSGDARQLG